MGTLARNWVWMWQYEDETVICVAKWTDMKSFVNLFCAFEANAG